MLRPRGPAPTEMCVKSPTTCKRLSPRSNSALVRYIMGAPFSTQSKPEPLWPQDDFDRIYVLPFLDHSILETPMCVGPDKGVSLKPSDLQVKT